MEESVSGFLTFSRGLRWSKMQTAPSSIGTWNIESISPDHNLRYMINYIEISGLYPLPHSPLIDTISLSLSLSLSLSIYIYIYIYIEGKF